MLAKSFLISLGLVSASLDFNYGVGPENSNCGDVAKLLDATIYAIGSQNQAEALARTSAYVDPENFVRFCTEGIWCYDQVLKIISIVHQNEFVCLHISDQESVDTKTVSPAWYSTFTSTR